MSKLLIMLGLLSVAAFVIVGGCTPEANKTWSEGADSDALDLLIAGVHVRDVSGTYAVSSDVDGRLSTLVLMQAGTSIQAYDNLRRSWFGYISGGAGPMITETQGTTINTIPTTGTGLINIETGDGGSEVISGSFGSLQGSIAFNGLHYTPSATGYIIAVGPIVGDIGGDDTTDDTTDTTTDDTTP